MSGHLRMAGQVRLLPTLAPVRAGHKKYLSMTGRFSFSGMNDAPAACRLHEGVRCDLIAWVGLQIVELALGGMLLIGRVVIDILVFARADHGAA